MSLYFKKDFIMRKLFVLLFSSIMSFKSYGGIGDKYFCEEKEDTEAVGKHKILIDWTENSVIKTLTINSIPSL